MPTVQLDSTNKCKICEAGVGDAWGRVWWLGCLNSNPPTPKPLTLNPKPSTLNSTPYTLNPKPSTLDPTPYTLHPTP